MRRPAPIKPKVQQASYSLSKEALRQLAEMATYIGSAQHKDTMSFSGSPSPRRGAMHVGEPDETPDCMLCPRKWANEQRVATELLRTAIKLGQFSACGDDELPKFVWARDPVDHHIVYEARRLSNPPNGYKAYPLTAKQIALLRVIL